MLNFGLFILLSSMPLSQGTNCNETIFGGPADKGLPCDFPFVYYGKSYDRCTSAYEVNERPWCATRVYNITRELIDENKDWGYCDSRCPFIDFYGEIFENGTTTTTTASPSSISGPQLTLSTTKSPISFTMPQPSKVLLRTLSTKIDVEQTFGNVESSHESGEWIPSISKNECGQSISLGFVFGGEDANIGEFPFAVLLGYKSVTSSREYDYICGGVLLNRRYVLTAAHCHSADKPIAVVVLGEFDTTMDPDCMAGCRPAQRFTGGLEVIQHPRFHLERNVAHNDIALIRLPKLAKTVDEGLQTFVAPVCLPAPSNKNNNKTMLNTQELIVVGWGKTTYEKNDFFRKGIGTEKLQKLSLKIVPNRICSEQFRKITEHHICAGGKFDEDSCNGDSGSPLISRQTPDSPMVLEGIVSFGTDVCGIGAPGVYTKVADYIDWIKSNLRP